VDVLYPISGFAVGVIVGMTGVGGGSLMTPLLILVFGFSPSIAVGTDLLYAAITKSAGAIAHRSRGNVDWRIVRALAAGSLPAAALTLTFLHTLRADAAVVSSLISATLGFALLATAAALLLRNRAMRRAANAAASPAREAHGVRVVLLGVVLGALVTLSSVGAGALGMVALLILFPHVPTVRIVGTDIAHAVPLTLVAGLGHAALGGVDYALLASLLAGSIPGIWLGSIAATRFSERFLRSVLATLLLALGVRLVL
jgi:uncharacterized membrane protein YfcA